MLWLEDGFLVGKTSEQRALLSGTGLLTYTRQYVPKRQGEGTEFLLLMNKLAVMKETTLCLAIVLARVSRQG